MSQTTVMKIAVIPGDGIGPEVIDAGLRVLNHVNDARNLGLELVHFGWNADEYLRTGISIPPRRHGRRNPGVAVDAYPHWNYDWDAETEALCDPRVRKAIADRGIELVAPTALGLLG